MTTNKEWLFSLPLEEQYAWMNAERTESPTSATMQQIRQVIESTVKRGVYGDTEPENADSREQLEADVRGTVPEWHVDMVIGWLDRQAAITERDATKRHELFCETCEAESDKQIAELTAERDNLADDLLVADKQREWYRKKFGKCIDYADAIHALMDEGMA